MSSAYNRSVFSQALNQHLAERAMTQGGLAQAMGVSQQAVSSWLRGQSLPTYDKVMRLEDVLGLAPATLVSLAYPTTEPPPDGVDQRLIKAQARIEDARRRRDEADRAFEEASRRLAAAEEGVKAAWDQLKELGAVEKYGLTPDMTPEEVMAAYRAGEVQLALAAAKGEPAEGTKRGTRTRPRPAPPEGQD